MPLLRKHGKAFRILFLMKCVYDIEGFEFGLLSAESPLGPFTVGYGKPHHDAMYKERKKDGDFEGDE